MSEWSTLHFYIFDSGFLKKIAGGNQFGCPKKPNIVAVAIFYV